MQLTALYVNLSSYTVDYPQTMAASGTTLLAISGIFSTPLPQKFVFAIQHNKAFSFSNQTIFICYLQIKS